MEKNINKQGAENDQFPGYPPSAPGEDIYNKEEHVPIEENPVPIEGLDVPGSELDDANEQIGEEDEENNSYSIGGDRHHELEENQE